MVSEIVRKPTLSVLLSAYNSEAHIKASVESILNQTHTDLGLIIVDDGSSDGTSTILAGFSDPRIKILINDANIGLTRSLNRAIRASSSPLLARQDADDISLPDRLAKQIRFMEEHPDVVLLGTGRYTLTENGTVLKDGISPLKNPGFQNLLRTNTFVHGSVVFRRSALDEVGPYDETFRYTQDYELWLRLAKRFRVCNLEESLYAVRRHAERVTLKKLPLALLYRLLARNIHAAEGDGEALRMVRERGIESYYEMLSKEDKVFFHEHLLRKYARNRLYDEAFAECMTLRSLQPLGLRILPRMIHMGVGKLLA